MVKNDGNSIVIRKALIDAGATVERIQQVPGRGLKGLPDFLVGFKGVNYLLEVKLPGEKLTNDQPEWFDRWRGMCAMVTSPEEALRAIGAIS